MLVPGRQTGYTQELAGSISVTMVMINKAADKHAYMTLYVCVCVGPTVLEVFNTLLKHLRMSVDFELGDGSRRNSAVSVSSGRSKESEERIVQNAIIQTIGTTSCLNTHSHLEPALLQYP